MENIVIDTSIFIDYDRTGEGIYIDLLKLAKNEQAKLFVPTIVIMEFWIGSSMKDTQKQQKAELFFKTMERIPLTEKIAKLGATLVRDKKIARGFDAIVAASSLSYEASLATLNMKHFKAVSNLKLL